MLAADALLFRTGLYPSILDPDSSTGLFELIFRREQKAQIDGGPNLVVTLGSSRLAYSPKYLDQNGLNQPYPLRNAGIAGSNARVWYYMMRDLDPTRRRYRAVVLALDDFDDEDRAGRPARRYPRTALCPRAPAPGRRLEFSRNVRRSRAALLQALRGALLRGPGVSG